LITSLYFFPFLVCCIVIYWSLPTQILRTVFLSAVSLIFVGYYDLNASILIILLTAYAYLFSYLISKGKNKSLIHKISVAGFLLILIISKYLGLLTDTFNNITAFFNLLPELNMEKILPPLGISYITFKLISYLTDVYWRVTEKGKFIDVLCYTSLFTIYTAGPIERFERFNPQTTEKRKLLPDDVETGVKRIIYGLFKKLVIADWIGYFIAPVLQNQEKYSTAIRALALFGFSIEIYTDFAGYSDIAIGSSRLFGFKIMENFDKPYFQSSITKFWRHWHISLSDWIRDYIFFPLSGFSQRKIWLLFFVPVISMALCGLWHSASWNFMIWGIWHGAGISVYQIFHYYKKKNKISFKFENTVLFKHVSIVFTFIFVTIGWWWFL
jgi:D-alanyl-lipoteichoic acid acyltransferase DltB (MBOAT superfamily)